MARYLYLLILPLFFSCSKDKSTTPLSKNQVLSSDCLKSAVLTDLNGGGCYFDSTYTCELIEIQEYFPISDENKEWLKAFCLNDFDKIFFHDESGNETFLEVSGTRFLPSNVSLRGEECQTDPDRSVAYCINTEVASVEFRVPIAALTFTLEIRNSFSGQTPDSIQASFFISASTFNFSPNPGETQFINHFNVQPDREDFIGQEFFSEIDFLGKKFKDVYSSVDVGFVSPSPDALKIFYNKEFGIVSFIDNNNTQWVLND